MKSRWFSTEEDLKLIAMVRDHSVLYKSDFHSYQEKEIVWNLIASEIGKSAIVCKSRWQSIKGYYKQNLKYQILGIATSKSKYHDSLSFLFETKAARRTLPMPPPPNQQDDVNTANDWTYDVKTANDWTSCASAPGQCPHKPDINVERLLRSSDDIDTSDDDLCVEDPDKLVEGLVPFPLEPAQCLNMFILEHLKPISMLNNFVDSSCKVVKQKKETPRVIVKLISDKIKREGPQVDNNFQVKYAQDVIEVSDEENGNDTDVVHSSGSAPSYKTTAMCPADHPRSVNGTRTASCSSNYFRLPSILKSRNFTVSRSSGNIAGEQTFLNTALNLSLDNQPLPGESSLESLPQSTAITSSVEKNGSQSDTTTMKRPVLQALLLSIQKGNKGKKID